MPQPLSRVMPGASIVMCNAGDRPLRHNSELGLLAMEAIISWSNVERFMLDTYIHMLGGPSEPAAVAYLALEAQNAKTTIINAVANDVLEDNYRDLLMAIIKTAKTGQTGRDKLAHWTWGYSPEIPDAFLLANPKHTYDGISEEHIYVYRERDFQKIIDHNDLVCEFGMKFKRMLSQHPSNKDDAIYLALCAEPALRERLSRQA
ncbi:hypothetical protein [Methylorubrum sp. SB2]|uniref:hypothetical protein n=1 Tax=Methylorubrum subtropicum TaxID=3138812 RepID=UPI00313DDCC1